MNKCKWAQGDFEEICVNADCPMCADFCPVLVEPGVCRFEDRGKRTNADKIRAMTDEELAQWLADCAYWIAQYEGKAHPLLKMLQQEVEE